MPRSRPDRGDVHDDLDRDALPPYEFVCLRDESDDGTIRLTVSGELDIATAPELDHALRTAQLRARSVTIDLRRLTFMDARGLGVIVAAAERAGAASDRFRVLRGPPHVHRLFTLSEADRRIDIAHTA